MEENTRPREQLIPRDIFSFDEDVDVPPLDRADPTSPQQVPVEPEEESVGDEGVETFTMATDPYAAMETDGASIVTVSSSQETVAATPPETEGPIRHVRFKDAPWYNYTKDIIVIGGVGGIGSWVSVLLARANFTIYMIDMDTVEEQNLGGQFYSEDSLGQAKVLAMSNMLKIFAKGSTTYFNNGIMTNDAVTSYCFSCFDNMTARKTMFDSWKKIYSKNSHAIFIDGRLEAEQMWIYCIRGTDTEAIEKYTQLLEQETDETIAATQCTFRQTSFSAAMIASHMVGFFVNHITNLKEGKQLRAVPYSWEYYIPLDALTI